MPRLFLVLAALLPLLPGLAKAADWQVDASHSQVVFTVRHITGEVTGFFNEFQGQVSLDPENPNTGSINMQVIATSLDTGLARRDRILLSPEFLDAGLHPTIRFTSETVEDKGGGAFVAHGHLNLNGVSRSVDLPFEIVGVADSPLPDQPCTEVMGIRGRLTINRLDYDVGRGRHSDTSTVGDEVALTIRSELVRIRPDCPGQAEKRPAGPLGPGAAPGLTDEERND